MMGVGGGSVRRPEALYMVVKKSLGLKAGETMKLTSKEYTDVAGWRIV